MVMQGEFHPVSQSDPDVRDVGLGIYIHIPFCVSKCSYCAFSSIAGGSSLFAPYLEALHREIERCSPMAAGRIVRSLYFGGGTPSLLPPTAINGLLDHCHRAFRVAAEAEITLEANPETVTDSRVRAYLEAGINRISMGVQSLDPQELTALGRAHSAQRAIVAYHAIRRAGCQNVSLDLLYGLPGQTVEGWQRTLIATLDLAPDHLSAYALTPEPGTEFGIAVANSLVRLPDEDVVEQQETVLFQSVARFGLVHYEISNYAREGLACRHNMLYWRCDDWLGFGASAHSHIAGRRWWNEFDPEQYIQGVARGTHLHGTETLALGQRISEALSLGLRMVEGVSRLHLIRRFGTDPWILKREALARLVADGLVLDDSLAVRLTPRGRALADSVASALC